MMTVTVITPDGDPVATIANHYFRRGTIRPLTWNGRDSAGAVVPDGLYKLRIHLRHQTITLPNTIQVDTTPPSIAIKRVAPRVFSPDHDGRREYVTISFGVSSTARPLLYVGRRQVGRGRLARSAGSIHWYGGVHGETYPPGVYQLSLRAEDRAGNISPPTSDVRVAIRYLTLARKVVQARAGKRFALRVASDAKSVQWLLRAKSGQGTPGTLRIRAPEEAGSVQALRHLQRPLAGGARGRLEVTAELARAGGPIRLRRPRAPPARDPPRPSSRRPRAAYARRPLPARVPRTDGSSAAARGGRRPRPGRGGRRRLALPALAVARRRSPRSLAFLHASRSSWDRSRPTC